MVDDGLSLDEALRRVARQHGIQLQHALPPLEALHAAIHDYRELFRPKQLLQMQEQRRLAVQAMSEFSLFHPKLVGTLLHGDGPLDVIRLLLSADTPEQVMHHLSDRHIPWQDTEIVLTYSGKRKVARPAMRFLAGETMVELVVLDHKNKSDPPRNSLSGGQLEMLDVEQLNALIKQTTG